MDFFSLVVNTKENTEKKKEKDKEKVYEDDDHAPEVAINGEESCMFCSLSFVSPH